VGIAEMAFKGSVGKSSMLQSHQLEDALKMKSIEREVLLNSIPSLVYYKDRASTILL